VAGSERKVILRIPPLVAHAVQNLEDRASAFINLPTRAYDHADPDKYRLAIESGMIDYDFSR
jgi:dTDP-4-dehydrorhamnose 3,5-epimerase